MAGSRVPGPIGTLDTPGMEEDEPGRHSPSAQAMPPGPNDAIATDEGGSGRGSGGGGSGAGSLVLTLLGDFDNPWKGDPKAEADAIDNKIWEPATDTFNVVARHPNNNLSKQEVKICPTFGSFLGAILNASGKIARINVISHTNSGLVAFGGTINAKKKGVTLNVNANPGEFTAMDSAVLVDLRDESKEWFLDNQKFTIKDIREKFAANAEIVLYACGSGFNLAFLRDVALTFKVTVRGFKSEIIYYAQWDNTEKNEKRPPKIVITRTETAYNNPPANPPETGHQSGFMHLKSDISASP